MEYNSAGIYSDFGKRACFDGCNGIWLRMDGSRPDSPRPRKGSDSRIKEPYQLAGRQIFGFEMMNIMLLRIWYFINPNAREIAELKKRVGVLEDNLLDKCS